MFCSIGRIGEGFAALVFTQEWLLSCVASVMDFQVFKTGKTALATILL